MIAGDKEAEDDGTKRTDTLSAVQGKAGARGWSRSLMSS